MLGQAVTTADAAGPITDLPTWYLTRTIDMPRSEWERMTGLSSGASADDLAEAFEEVIKKEVRRGGTSRAAFGEWHAVNAEAPTASELAGAEQRLADGSFGVLQGFLAEGYADQNTPKLTVEYFVVMEPAKSKQLVSTDPQPAEDIEEYLDTPPFGWMAVGFGVGASGVLVAIGSKATAGQRALGAVGAGVLVAGLFGTLALKYNRETV